MVNSQQFKRNYNKLRAIIQAYLNTNKTWIVNDFRETVPMDVDYIGKSKAKRQEQRQKRQQQQGQEQRKEQGSQSRQGQRQDNSKRKGKGKPSNDKECFVCGKRGHLARDCWSRANHDKTVNEVEVEDPNAEPDEEYVYTIDHEVNVVDLSQSGCGVNKIKEKKTAREWDPRTPGTNSQGMGPKNPRTNSQGMGPKNP